MLMCCSTRATGSIRRSAKSCKMRCAIFGWRESTCKSDAKTRYCEVAQHLAQLATKFSENVLDAGRAYTRSVTDGAELAGLPANAVDRAAADAREANQPGWLFKLDQPTYMTVMASAESAQLRRDIYEAWVTRASELGPSAGRFDNNPIIADILPLRHELARPGGIQQLRRLRPGHADGEEQQAGADLSGRPGAALPACGAAGVLGSGGICRPQAQCLGHGLLQRAAAGEPLQGVAGSAAAVFSAAQGAVRSVRADSQALRHHVRERPGIGVWHPSVRYYELLDQHEAVVAGFFLDPYSRTEKRSGAWMDECVVAKSLPTGTALPVAQLVCNFTAPVGSAPSLLTHDEVTTLFHEFGHGLHHMLTRVAYPSIAGINGVAWDAVELPSQFMENFVWRPRFCR
jgi:oligopeptidase A